MKYPRSDRGCQWQDSQGDANYHIEENCQYQNVNCSNKPAATLQRGQVSEPVLSSYVSLTLLSRRCYLRTAGLASLSPCVPGSRKSPLITLAHLTLSRLRSFRRRMNFSLVILSIQRSQFNRATFYTETEAVVYEIYERMRKIHGMNPVLDCDICPC